MKNYFYLSCCVFLANCSKPDSIPNTTPKIVYKKTIDFPHTDGTIYGTWLEATEFVAEGSSNRRLFYISPQKFALGQWCFVGTDQNFNYVEATASAFEDTLEIFTDLVGSDEKNSVKCKINFLKGIYSINFEKDKNMIHIILPQTGEVFTGMRYYPPEGVP